MRLRRVLLGALTT